MKGIRRSGKMRLACVCLAVLCLLTGCAGRPEANGGQSAEESGGAPMQTSLQYACTAVQSDVTQYLSQVEAWGMDNGSVWACGPREEGGMLLVHLDEEGKVQSSRILTMPQRLPTQGDGQAALQWGSVCSVGSNGIWAILSERVITVQKDGSWTNEDYMAPLAEQVSLCRADEEGVLQREIVLQLPQEVGSSLFLTGHVFWGWDDEPWVTVNGQDKTGGSAAWLMHFNRQGECLRSEVLAGGDMVLDMLPLSRESMLLQLGHSGRVGAGLWMVEYLGAGKPGFRKLELEPLTYEGSEESFVSACFVRGSQQQDTVLLYGSNALYRIDLAEESWQRLFSLWEVGLRSTDDLTDGVRLMQQLPDGRLLAVTGGYPSGPYRLNVLSEEKAEEPDARQVLTLALANQTPESFKRLVREFNSTSPSVTIELLDYSDEGARLAGYDSGADMLNRAIVQGKVPDIVMLSLNNAANGYVSKGLFVDLYPYIDADPVLQRTDFVQGILQAGEYDGTLPLLIPAYWVISAIGDPEVLGSSFGWSMQQYLQVLAENPQVEEPFWGTGRNTVLANQIEMAGNVFLDYNAGQCHLDDPAFVRMLEDSASNTTEFNDQSTDPKPGFGARQLLLRNVWQISFRQLLQWRYEFDGDFVYKGFPGDGTLGSAVLPALQLGISTSCSDPQAAWSFVRKCLLPQYQDNLQNSKGANISSFPLRYDSLQKAADKATQPLQPGDTIVMPSYSDDEDYWRGGVLQQDVDQLLKLIDSITVIQRLDYTAMRIVEEEAEVFYAGQCTAAQAAAVMQSRIQTYLDERK